MAVSEPIAAPILGLKDAGIDSASMRMVFANIIQLGVINIFIIVGFDSIFVELGIINQRHVFSFLRNSRECINELNFEVRECAHKLNLKIREPVDQLPFTAFAWKRRHAFHFLEFVKINV
ncbi:MAG: hypothetical protein FWG97_05155 [Deltaproteobacteria bacterium]|nr:hypothetical protein [Deltaproteobacteria bacterium]